MDFDANSLDYVQLRRIADFFVKTRVYDALFYEDQILDVFDIVKTSAPISHLMFPIVTKAIKTGSRSERVYLSMSDYDFIYEISPLLVEDFGMKTTSDNNKGRKLWYKETKNAGFYTVFDDEKGFLIPNALQTQVAHLTDLTKIVS